MLMQFGSSAHGYKYMLSCKILSTIYSSANLQNEFLSMFSTFSGLWSSDYHESSTETCAYTELFLTVLGMAEHVKERANNSDTISVPFILRHAVAVQ